VFILVFFSDFLSFFIMLFSDFLNIVLVFFIGLLYFLLVFLSKNLANFSSFVNLLILKFLDCRVVLSVLFSLCPSKCLNNRPKELVITNFPYTIKSNRFSYIDLIYLRFLPYSFRAFSYYPYLFSYTSTYRSAKTKA
jgi:hypothetical protein